MEGNRGNVGNSTNRIQVKALNLYGKTATIRNCHHLWLSL